MDSGKTGPNDFPQVCHSAPQTPDLRGGKSKCASHSLTISAGSGLKIYLLPTQLFLGADEARKMFRLRESGIKEAFCNLFTHMIISSQYGNCVLSPLPAPCDADAFFCHSNMCINYTLVCNGMQNCVYPWDENQCKGEMLHSISVI